MDGQLAESGRLMVCGMKRHGDANRIFRMNLCLVEEKRKLWLYRIGRRSFNRGGKTQSPKSAPAAQAIRQVVLKRLITAEQVIERLGAAETMCQLTKEMRYKPRP